MLLEALFMTPDLALDLARTFESNEDLPGTYIKMHSLCVITLQAHGRGSAIRGERYRRKTYDLRA